MYRAAVPVLVLGVATALAIGIIWWHKRRRFLWALAEQNPTWEPFKDGKGRYVQVGVQLVAKVGRRKKVIRTIGLDEIDTTGHDWMQAVFLAQIDARQHAQVLNDKGETW